MHFYFMFFIKTCYGQFYFDQTLHKGGVTGSGYSPSSSDIIFSGNIQIGTLPIGATITKAYLFASRIGQLNPIALEFNSEIFYLNSSNIVISNFNSSMYGGISGIHLIDVSSFVNEVQSNYTISSSTIQPTSSNRFSDFYLIIYYENPLSTTTNTVIILNDVNFGPQTIYPINNLNIIDLSQDVGLCLSSGYICEDTVDGEIAYINNLSIGSFGGNNINSGNCGGPFGSFIYQNNSFVGINGNDPNTGFNSSNVIKKINSELSSSTSMILKYETIQPDNYSNSIWLNLLTYTTPCDTFSVSVPNDTVVCKGSQLQLNASGGQTYQWLPAAGLSCSNCPNPVFTADSSMHYTVRIWNNDTCSVVRPVKINVSSLPTFSSIVTTPTTCGTTNGTVVLMAANTVTGTPEFSMNGGAAQTSGSFTGLAQGNDTFTITDSNGCVGNDSIVNIGVINPTVASFIMNPTSGEVPLNINLVNTSQQATDFLWSINGINQGSNLTTQTLNTAGTYSFELIAWQYDVSCADTAIKTIIVLNKVIIPTAFTPNNDFVNDLWELENLDEQYPKNTVRVYNRWGTLIYESIEGKYTQQPWKGDFEGKPLPVASYYFIIEPNDGNSETMKGTVSVLGR